LYILQGRRLICQEIGTGRALPAPDISEVAPSETDLLLGVGRECLALSRTGDLVTTGGANGSVFAWDTVTSSLVATFAAQQKCYRSKVAFDPSGTKLVMSFVHQPSGAVTHVAYDANRRRILGGLTTGVRTTAGMQRHETYSHHSTATFSGDGRRIYVSDGERILVCAGL
jgi:hypothetical protein